MLLETEVKTEHMRFLHVDFLKERCLAGLQTFARLVARARGLAGLAAQRQERFTSRLETCAGKRELLSRLVKAVAQLFPVTMLREDFLKFSKLHRRMRGIEFNNPHVEVGHSLAQFSLPCHARLQKILLRSLQLPQASRSLFVHAACQRFLLTCRRDFRREKLLFLFWRRVVEKP